MTRYAFDDFCLDVAARALSRSGVPVALTPRVFDTLLHLLERRGELVDKDELMQAVWPSRVVEENNLNQAISALRRALGETRGEHRYILTVPGRGYRFVGSVHATSSVGPMPATKPLRSLAVLPFKLLQPAGDEALQTGMADTLITRLSGIGELVVRPLSAVCRFGGQQHDPLEVGRKTVRGMTRNDGLILSHPEHGPDFLEIFEASMAALPDEPVPEGRAHIEKLRREANKAAAEGTLIGLADLT